MASNPLIGTHLHSVANAGALEGKFRLLIQNPEAIVRKYVDVGMNVLDLGCGTGYFTLPIARLLGNRGKVVAADVQVGMLQLLRRKLDGNIELLKRIQVHNSTENAIGLDDKFDFVLAFYSFHEMKHIDSIISNLTKMMKPGAKILISEQRFHVSKVAFNYILQKLIAVGFEVCERPFIFLSRTVVMEFK